MASMKLEVVSEDQSLRKWCVPLREDIFATFMAKGSPIMHKNPCVDWLQTDSCYVLKSELPKIEKSSVRICVENGKVMEISGVWKNKGESSRTDWRSGEWWEHGFVRRLELPENTDWKKTEAYVYNDTVLDIRLPKTPSMEYCTEGVIKESSSG
ncbi:21.7 kDa class VI heat shock protein isoform X2 [Lactuca sativa]|uniref:21.7 kDa class VI heat shock protein isoform X2 n=1 Tax=Lactuca sativa TaxID=4236 RepID=UPI000CD9DA23|nr:21.7 kDa class VI heat shock protein isoform X2 [Lactuca sativa]